MSVPTGTWWSYPELREVVPDGLGGVLVRWNLVEQAPRPGGLYDYTWHAKVTRVVGPTTTEFVLPSPGTTIAMVGDEGTGYLTPGDGGNSYAVDVATWTTKWVSPASGLPSMAIAGGGLAVHDAALGTLSIVDEAGTLRATTPLSLNDAYQTLRAGEWIGAANVGTIAAVQAPFFIGSGPPPTDRMMVQVSVFSFTNQTGGVTRQSSATGGFPNERRAAFEALEFIYPQTRATGWEWGGTICTGAGRYFRSAAVTDEDAGSVNPSSAQCPGVVVAEYHTHTLTHESYPSGHYLGWTPSPLTGQTDETKAISRPDLRFYLRTHAANDQDKQETYRYQAIYGVVCPGYSTDQQFWSARRNVFRWSQLAEMGRPTPPGTWQPYDSNPCREYPVP